MIVEDNKFILQLLQEALSDSNHELYWAEDGKNAIKVINEKKPDIVLMDIQLPLLSGIEVTKFLRSQGNEVPVIAMTANALKGDRERCLEAGMDDYLSKPFNINELEPFILNVIKRKKITYAGLENNQNVNNSGITSEADFNYSQNSIGSENIISEVKSKKNISNNKNELKIFNIEQLFTYMNGSEKLMKKTVTMFINDTSDYFTSIKETIDKKEFEKIVNAAHRFKSIAAFACAERVSDLLAKIENAAKEKNIEELKILKIEIIKEFDIYKKEISSLKFLD